MADYQYPGAGAKAPRGVKAAIRRFRSLPIVEKQRTPLLYYLLGSTTGPYKMDADDADYQSPTPVRGQRCDNCRHAWQNVPTGQIICALIQGNIAPEAWCRLWQPPK